MVSSSFSHLNPTVNKQNYTCPRISIKVQMDKTSRTCRTSHPLENSAILDQDHYFLEERSVGPMIKMSTTSILLSQIKNQKSITTLPTISASNLNHKLCYKLLGNVVEIKKICAYESRYQDHPRRWHTRFRP